MSLQQRTAPDQAFLDSLLTQLYTLTRHSRVSSGQLFQSEHLLVFIYLHLGSDFQLDLSEQGQGSLLSILLVRLMACGTEVPVGISRKVRGDGEGIAVSVSWELEHWI